MADLSRIKTEFLDIYAHLAHGSEDLLLEGSQACLYPCFERLDRLAAMDVDDGEASNLREDPELKKVLGHISGLKRANGLRLEIHRAKMIIGSSAPWEMVEQFVYHPNYLELARMEYTGGGLSPGNRVIFLGSGPLPMTLISLCTQYEIRGVGIEQIPEYASLSQRLISVLGLADQIRIVPGNHFSLPLPDPYDLIMIGADAMPKEEIFSHLAKTLEIGSKLSYRIYEKGLRRLLDVQSDFQLPFQFEEYARVRPQPPVNNTSVFAVKCPT